MSPAPVIIAIDGRSGAGKTTLAIELAVGLADRKSAGPKGGGERVALKMLRPHIVGDDEATALLKIPYRGPWQHPADSL